MPRNKNDGGIVVEGFELKKGQGFSLSKGITNVFVGLGWKVGDGYDLDASVFGLRHLEDGTPHIFSNAFAVCYANINIKQPDETFRTPDGSIHHLGDNRTGAGGDGDKETIKVDLSKLPDGLVELSIFVTIYEAGLRRQRFGAVSDSYVRVIDAVTNATLCNFKLGEEFAGAAAVQVGSFLKKKDGNWEFVAVGAGSSAEMGDILRGYGIPV